MSRAIHDLLATTLGTMVTRTPEGMSRVAPRSPDDAATVLGLAHRHGWKVRLEGARSWMPADAPADLALTTAALDRVVAIAPADLVATVQAGTSLRTLDRQLGLHRARLALDPPGAPDRSLGSVLATATAGPLRHRFGPVRDQVLGTTVVTADGKLVRAGGSVVKNVAGYDLSKLQIGGFGAFGLVVEAHLRLRAIPASRRVVMATGALDPLFHAARALVDAEIDAETVELLSPMATASSQWRLMVEVAGTEAGTAAELARARAAAAPIELLSADGGGLGSAVAQSFLEGLVSVRAGVLPASLPDLADLTIESLGPGRMSLSPGRGGLRWSGTATAEALAGYRTRLAQQEIPVTIERAPWAIRSAVGHFGAFREGVVPLTNRVRTVFDPAGILVTPLEAAGG